VGGNHSQHHRRGRVESLAAGLELDLVKAKGVLVQVTFHGGNALAQKDRLIALLKAAAAAL